MDYFKSLLMKVNPGAPRPKDGEPLLLAPNDNSWWRGCSFDAVPGSFAAKGPKDMVLGLVPSNRSYRFWERMTPVALSCAWASVSRAEISQGWACGTGMDVNANSQSSLSTDLNHPQVAIAEKLGNSSSIVGSTSEECLVSDNIHGSASDMLYDGDGSDGEDVDGDDVGDDDYDEQYDDLYDDNDYDYMFDNSDDENNKKKQKVSDDDYLSMQLQFDNVDLPTGVEASVPDFANIDTKASASRRRAIPANFSSNAKEGTEKELDAVQKYLTFKRFDIVDDFSDHRYLKTLHGTQPTPAWKKKIQDEWKILQNNLPEPYFNEPGFHRVKENMKSSKKYSEDAFILSLRTMMYTLKNPPKHFEDFVTGHFRVWGRVILIACRAYMEGAVLGSDVKGKIEDSDKADVSQLQGFKKDVATILNKLVESFVGNGSTDCEDLRLAD
ncbi:hypothetical protein AgCh_013892 [Apium graveolens]